MKKVILLLLMSWCTVEAHTYYMSIRMKDGSYISFAIDDIQKITFSNITSVNHERAATIIKNFVLLQNYPNPFNPATTIQYQIPNSGEVVLKIFNIQGQLANKVIIPQPNAGTFSFTWNGNDANGNKLPSGPYLYQLSFNTLILTRKMILVK